MGCGAGIFAPRDATPDEVKEMCLMGCKEMNILCVKAAMEKAGEIKIVPPPCVNQYRENAIKLRSAADYAKESITEVAEGDTFQNLVGGVAGGGGGMFGKMMGMVAQAADAATEMAGKGAGALLSGALNGMAAAIDKAIDEIEEPFTDVGRKIVEQKKDEIVTVFCDYINKCPFENPTTLVRGEAPHGPEQYEACPPDSVTKALLHASVEKLADPLLGVVQPAINEHAVTKGWDVIIESVNSAHDKISKYKDLEQFGIEKVELDINVYIVKETLIQLGVMMSAEEAVVRPDPAGKSRIPETFAVVFSGTNLTVRHYNNRGS